MASSEKSNKSVQTVAVISTLEEVIDFMMKEQESGKPNDHNIRRCMDVSFEYRRNLIITSMPPVSVSELQKLYPALFSISQVIEEFSRIMYPGVFERFLTNVKACRYSIIKYASPDVPIRHHIERKRKLCKDRQMLEYIDTAGALLLLPSLLQEDISQFINFSSIKLVPTENPIIKCNAPVEDCFSQGTKFRIYIERIKLCETDDLLHAFFVFSASFYIFNVSYSSSIEETMAVVERELLQIPPEMEEPSKKVLEVTALLKQSKKRKAPD